MESIGQILKAARERKRLTTSQVAAKIRMQVQQLEAMERDDFSRIPAPTYAKGFIRMYADYIGVDSKPLVEAYIQQYVTPSKVRVDAAPSANDPEADARQGRDVMPKMGSQIFSVHAWKNQLITGAVILFLLVLLISLRHCGQAEKASDATKAVPVSAKSTPAGSALGMMKEPPEPFLKTTPGPSKGKNP